MYFFFCLDDKFVKANYFVFKKIVKRNIFKFIFTIIKYQNIMLNDKIVIKKKENIYSKYCLK
jgi:hypothetical protein